MRILGARARHAPPQGDARAALIGTYNQGVQKWETSRAQFENEHFALNVSELRWGCQGGV